MTDPTDAAVEPRRRHRSWYALGLILALCILAAVAVWVGVRALMVKDDVDAIQSLAPRLNSAIAAHDLPEIAAVNRELSTHAERAVRVSSDPLWTTAEALPVVGANLSAVRVAVTAVEVVSARVVSPILQISSGLTADASHDALAKNFAVGGPLDEAASALHEAAEQMSTIPSTHLVAPVASGVERLRGLITQADRVLQPLAASAHALPGLVGPGEPQTLLLMIQNPAELRTGGGITGTFLQLRVDNGTFTLQKQRDSSAFAYRTTPIVPVPESLTALYGDVTGRFVQDASIPADFSLTAQLVTAWWTGHGGTKPDAVLSIDPLVLRALLAVTGPVSLPDGSALSAANLEQRVLIDPYLTMTSDQQSSFFAQATTAVFTRVFSQGVTPVQWVQALAEPIQEGRISVWSADSTTQSALEAGPLGGPLVRQQLAGAGAYAVYFNDNTGGKMATSMTTAITTAEGVCRSDGRRTVAVAVSLTSTAAKNAATLPISMTGGGLWGVGAGDIGMNVTVAAPKGAFFDGVTVDGTLARSVNVDAEGHPSSVTHVNLQPRETNVLTFRFVVDGDAPTTVVHTPMLTDPALTTAPLRCG